MWGYLQNITHQGHLTEASLEDIEQNSDLTVGKSKLIIKLHPCRDTDGCKDKTFVQGKVGTKFYHRTVTEKRLHTGEYI
jgi:hypothetical protein